MSSAVAPPSLGLYLTEIPRAFGELVSFAAVRPWLAGLPVGDGHSVLVVPGLQSNDESTVPLRGMLDTWGYSSHGWGLGQNIGPTAKAIDGLGELLDQLTTHQGEAISVIGWSLGGIFARELARRSPESVRQVITLGSPFAMKDPRQSRAYSLYESFAHLHAERRDLPISLEREPMPVPTTSIYSPYDGIVAWESCLNTASPLAENISVRGSHCGLGHHPAALFAIADRLRQPTGSWHPFSPPALLRHEFPTPAQRTPDAA